MPPLRQRLALVAMRSRSSSRAVAKRFSASLKQRGPIHLLLRDCYRFSRRHPVSVNQWDADYSGGDYADRLDTIIHVAHHAVILGYLTYGAEKPKILDVGCGHGRFLRLLADVDFGEYVGMDWSAEAIERARSLCIPRTRFEVADMNQWDTTERFDVVVLNNSLYYADDPFAMFERSLGWLADGGLAIVSMYRGVGVRYVWARVHASPVEQQAACAVKDDRTGAVWDVKVLQPRRSP